MERNIAASIIFCIITCGIYGIYWFICLTNEVNERARERDTSGGMAFLFSLITFGIYVFYWAYRLGKKTEIIDSETTGYRDSSNAVVYLILEIFGLNIIVLVMAQLSINKNIHMQKARANAIPS